MISVLIALVLAQAQDSSVLVAEGARQPHLVAGQDEIFYCTFLRNGNIEMSITGDGGKTWSAPVVAIDAKGRAQGGLQRGPRIGLDGKGNIYVSAFVCYDEEELAKEYPTAELWSATSTDGGKTFSRPVQINDVPKTAPEGFHSMAIDGKGIPHYVWLDAREGDGQDLFLASGPKLRKPMKIADQLCECCAPGMAVETKDLVVAWREGGKNHEHGRAIRYAVVEFGGKITHQGQVNQSPTKVGG